MGDWSEYFADYPGGYFGEHPETIPEDPNEKRNRLWAESLRARRAAKGAAFHAEVQELVAAHTPPATAALRQALRERGKSRPGTLVAFAAWLNSHFAKDLSAPACRRLISELEAEEFLVVVGCNLKYLK